MPERELSINDVAAMTGVAPHTLRYYERIGLLDRIARSPANTRRYTPADVAWLEFLLRLRDTGMPLREMRRFAALRRAGEHTAAERLRLLRAHRGRLDAQFAALRENTAALDRKIEVYRAMPHVADVVAAVDVVAAADPEGKPA